MINSHREFVKALIIFGEKNDLIKELKYLTDADHVKEAMDTVDVRGVIFRLASTNFDEDYNLYLRYKIAIWDKTQNSMEEVLESESENIFVASSMEDYINHVMDGECFFETMTSDSLEDKDTTMTSLSGMLTFVVKRNPSYWKQMEQFNA